MKKLFAFLTLFVSASSWAFVQLPPADTIVDLSKTLTHEQVLTLKQKAAEVEKATGTVAVTLIVSKVEDETIEQLAMRAAETWKVGKAGVDKAVVFAIAKDDRKMTIRTSRITGQQYTDLLTAATLNHVKSKFKTHDFYGGVSVFYDDVAKYTAPVVPEAAPLEEDNTWVWVVAALGVFLTGVVVAIVISSRAKREAERKRLEKDRRDRERRAQEFLERERYRIRMEEGDRKIRRSPPTTNVVPLQRRSKVYSTPAPAAADPTPYTPPPKDNSDELIAALAGAAIGALASSSHRSSNRDDDDDRPSRSSSSGDSDSSGGGLFSSDSGSFDGGGSSSDW
jgi:uncharacterized membrane protein YgcG